MIVLQFSNYWTNVNDDNDDILKSSDSLTLPLRRYHVHDWHDGWHDEQSFCQYL